MRKIFILFFLISCGQNYKEVLEIVDKGYRVKILTSDGMLKERENKVKFIIEPKPKSFKAYLYMPEMPGMPAMTEMFELNKNYEGKVFVSMSGEWFIILEIDGNRIEKLINIPFKGDVKHTHSQIDNKLIDFF